MAENAESRTIPELQGAHWPGLDYSTFPKTESEWLDALVRHDDGTFDCVPAFMRPYITAKDFSADGQPIVRTSAFNTPLSFAKFQFAFDFGAPQPPWSSSYGDDQVPFPAQLVEHICDTRPKKRRAVSPAPPLPPKRSEPEYADLYFIAVVGGPIKIGVAQEPSKRLKQLQTACPYQLELLATVRGAALRETEYHTLFAAHRLNGEWFERHPDILAEIERLNASQSA